MFKNIIPALLACLLLFQQNLFPASDNQTVTRLFDTIKPYLVSIDGEVFSNVDNKPSRDSFKKSGLIIDAKGHVLTSYLSSEITSNVKVYINQEEYPARLVGSDKVARISVLQIDSKLVPQGVSRDIRFAKSPLETGQSVLTAGCLSQEYQFEKAVTFGMVSTKIPIGLSYQVISMPIMDVDGFVLLNLNGEIAGLELRNFGFGLSLIDTKKENIKDEYDMMRAEIKAVEVGGLEESIKRIIKKQGDPDLCWMGLEMDSLSRTQAEGMGIPFKGILITEVYKNCPASDGGLLPKDVVVEINGRSIPADSIGTRLFIDTVRNNEPGKKMNFKAMRGGVEKTFVIDPIKFPKPKQARSAWLGLTVEEVNDALYNSQNLFTPKGMLIVNIEQGTPAMNAKLERLDVITNIQLAEVSKLGNWQNMINDLRNTNTKYIILQVYRGNRTLTRIIKPELGAKREQAAQ